MISVLSLFSLGLSLNLGTKQLRHSSRWTGAKGDNTYLETERPQPFCDLSNWAFLVRHVEYRLARLLRSNLRQNFPRFNLSRTWSFNRFMGRTLE